MTASRKIILGPPGTGKTTTLLDILDSELSGGVRPNEIAFLSFTKKATEEARSRAMSRFNLTKEELPWFRTIHSLAFNRIGLRRDEVMGSKHYREIGKALGLDFSGKGADIEEGIPAGRNKGDRYSFLDGFSRARLMAPEDAYRLCVNGDENLDWYEFKRFSSTLSRYKTDRGMFDFADMLEVEQAPLDVTTVIVDEAQDLSTAQHRYLERVVFPSARRIYIAGDDDQAIFQWSGADVAAFQSMRGDRTVLTQSRRIPGNVHRIAQRIAAGIRRRSPKEYRPKDEPGLVRYHNDPDSVDLNRPGSWLLLARNAYLLPQLVALVRNSGMPYTLRGDSAINRNHVRAILAWEGRRKGKDISQEDLDLIAGFVGKKVNEAAIWHEALTGIRLEDREWYISMLRRGESLTKPPRINISTIHGVKGGEADNVMLMTDMSARTWQGYQRDEDSERRVWYVGATRTRKELHIVQPLSKMGFDL